MNGTQPRDSSPPPSSRDGGTRAPAGTGNGGYTGGGGSVGGNGGTNPGTSSGGPQSEATREVQRQAQEKRASEQAKQRQDYASQLSRYSQAAGQSRLQTIKDTVGRVVPPSIFNSPNPADRQGPTPPTRPTNGGYSGIPLSETKGVTPTPRPTPTPNAGRG
ncbi:MAG: hypothetical protein RLZZ234_29, partial [Candidatus Parcubacteria bacterium]